MITTKFKDNKKASYRSKMFLNPLAFKLLKFKLEIWSCKLEVEDKKNK